MRDRIVAAALATAFAAPAAAAGIENVEGKIFETRDFRLENGQVLPELKLAYETYGTLAPDGRNAVLVMHGYTSNHHAAGRYAPGKAPAGIPEGQLGWWDELIGPGKAIDTDRLFVVSSNMLGSSYGSTNPASLDPATGRPYGPDFPEISLKDIVGAQHRLLDRLGVKHLTAVAGPSFGGYQAFQWAVTYPDFMDGVVVAVSAPKGSGDEKSVRDLTAQLARDPNWNGGRYYDKGGIRTVLTDMRVATLKRYGIEHELAAKFPDPKEREAAIRKAAAPWAETFDGNSLIVLRRASVRYDAEKDFRNIRAKLLYVPSKTDKLFPPSIASGVMAKLKAAGVDASFVELDSENGHLGHRVDAAKWAPALKDFMARLARQPS